MKKLLIVISQRVVGMKIKRFEDIFAWQKAREFE